jgi:LuxR family maltose regulon positive regulatory protein
VIAGGGEEAAFAMPDQPALGAAAQDALLATKLHIPAPRPDRVPRPRLTDSLDRGRDRALLLVCAPAGYGKTMVLAEWARSGEQQPAWLSLDAADNDPARFWRHVLAAVDRVRPGTADRFGGPPPSAPGSLELPATALINDLAAEPGHAPVRLVLDDYHLIDAPAVHALVDFLLEHRPPTLQLILASRADPPLALARLRAREELLEIRLAELRFTRDEAAALLRRSGSGPHGALSDTALEALAARTEGWAAGLQLAALSLRGHPDAAGFVASFTGSHRHVLDYLSEEVLERQREDVRTFLAETAVLERLSGPLCDALTGRTDSQQLLEQLERAGLFLIPLDDVRGWWRYHQLFADLLRARPNPSTERAAGLHRAAAGWYERHCLIDDAIHHRLAAHDSASAARLIEAHFDTVFNLRGEEATIRQWLPALPAELVRARPRLLLAQAQMAAMRGDVATMAPLVDAAEQAYARSGNEPFDPTAGKAKSLLVNIGAVIALQRSYLAQLRGDAEASIGYARQAQDLVGSDEATLGSAVTGFLAMDDWLRGRLDEAAHAFASGLAAWQGVDIPTTAGWASYSLARIQREAGNLEASDQTCRRALAQLTGADGRPLPAAGPAFVGLAAAAYLRNDLDAARRHLGDGIPLCRRFVHTPPLAAGLVVLAWIRQASGNPGGASAAMAEAAELAPGPAGLLNPVPAQLVRLQLVQGDLPGARRWVANSGLRVDDEASYPREVADIVLARVLLADGRPRDALALLDRLHTAAADQHRVATLIELGVLRALAFAACGDDEATLPVLVDALELAGPRGYVRVFTDEGEPLAGLLTRLAAARRVGRLGAHIPSGYLARVQRSFAGPEAQAAAQPAQSLTPREREVLQLLGSGRSNQAIAAELVVSLDTVKKHVSHILDKLGATNRTEAVAQGRELGLS